MVNSKHIAYISESSSVQGVLIPGRAGKKIVIDGVTAHFQGAAQWDEVRLEADKIGEYLHPNAAAIDPIIIWSLTSATAGQEYWCSDELHFELPAGMSLKYVVLYDVAGFCAVKVYYHYEDDDFDLPYMVDMKQTAPCTLLEKMMGAC